MATLHELPTLVLAALTIAACIDPETVEDALDVGSDGNTSMASMTGLSEASSTTDDGVLDTTTSESPTSGTGLTSSPGSSDGSDTGTSDSTGGSDGETQCDPASEKQDLGDRLSEYAVPSLAADARWLTPGANYIWFTETAANKIGRATFDGALTEFDIPRKGVAPKAISAGPGGARWFAGIGVLGSVTAAGQIELFDLPKGADAMGIGHGDPAFDEDVWYTDNGREVVARFRPPDEITEFAVPYAGSDLGDILFGPDENFWIVDAGTNQVLRLSQDGVFTPFAIPTADSGPTALTQSGGALWLTESSAGQIARVQTDGTFAEFPLPTPCAEPWGLTVAADGGVWFTQRATNRIGRMLVDGTFTDDFAIPTPDSQPSRIASKSNGTIWMLETQGNNLVRISPR